MSKIGKLIVLEGIDRSGKTTIAKKLASLYDPSHIISFPNRKLITGQIIDSYLSNKINLNAQTIHLLFSANRWEMNEKIFEMTSNKIVFCDRYFYSGVAYSAAKGLDIEWCKKPDLGLKKPDLVFFLDVKPEEVAKREGFGDEKYEKIEYLNNVYDILKDLVKNDENGVIINANENLEKIIEQIRYHIDK
ncbi:hypothetical protein GVAV_002057 [Gurleya vavrai]